MQRTILKGGDARVQALPLRDFLAKPVSPEAEVKAAPCETRVETLAQDGVVVGLEVHCSCGEVTRVSLDYAQSGEAPEAV